MKKVIILDFDGTIADTLDALVTVVNRLAIEFGYAQITPEELSILQKLTARDVIRYSGISVLKIPFLVKKVKSELKTKIPDLKPIEGMKETLYNLNDRGFRLGIITSNSQENVIEFLKINQMDSLFEFIHSGVTIFGKTTIINNVLRQNKIDPKTVVYVGDETRDIEASKKANIKVVAVTWGFNSHEVLAQQKPDYLIHYPHELIDIINSH